MHTLLNSFERIGKEDFYEIKNLKIVDRESFHKAVNAYYNFKMIPENPPQIHIEVTNYCNLRCKMCPRDKMTREQGFIDKDLCMRLIKDAADSGVYHLSLFMFGEPMMHPNILEFAEYAKKLKIPIVNITTNGILLDEKKADLLLDTGIDTLVISLESASKDNYLKMIGNESQYYKAIKNTEYIAKQKKKRGLQKPFIRLNSMHNPELISDKQVEDYKNYWSKLVDDVFVGSVGPFLYGNEFCNVTDEMKKMRIPCRHIWRHFVILWNGDITACCVDINGDVKLGNIKNKTLNEAWHSEEFDDFRIKHLTGKLNNYKVCQKCLLDWDG